jgi:hypothetical protein
MAEDSAVETQRSKTPAPNEVREALNRVLASAEFRSGQRACDFLRYVVEATLKGDADKLKERTIGIDVFGRSSSFEPSDDSSVRVKAGDVRKRLAVYYASPEGSAEQLLIELPVGSYVPQFRMREGEMAALPDATRGGKAGSRPIDRLGNEGPRLRLHLSRPLGLVSGVLAVLAVVITLAHFPLHYHRLPSPLGQFWAPVFDSSSPVLILVAPVPIYSLQKPLSLGPPEGKDFLLEPDQYVAVGDLKAEARIAEFMNRAKRPARVQIGNGIGFEDLRKAPAVLVGFSYNQWKDLNRGVRFTIDPDNETFFGITENGAPSNWRIALHPDDPKLEEDYAIVSRIFDRDTGQVLVQVSGISHYGTEGGADLITDPALLQQALQNAPDGWPRMNIQIVLHVRVISGVPAAPSIVATHFW